MVNPFPVNGTEVGGSRAGCRGGRRAFRCNARVAFHDLHGIHERSLCAPCARTADATRRSPRAGFRRLRLAADVLAVGRAMAPRG